MDLGATANGMIVGLVAITSGCAYIDTWASSTYFTPLGRFFAIYYCFFLSSLVSNIYILPVIVGIVAAIGFQILNRIAIFLKFDDPVDAIAVHVVRFREREDRTIHDRDEMERRDYFIVCDIFLIHRSVGWTLGGILYRILCRYRSHFSSASLPLSHTLPRCYGLWRFHGPLPFFSSLFLSFSFYLILFHREPMEPS